MWNTQGLQVERDSSSENVDPTSEAGILDIFASDVRGRTVLGLFLLGMLQFSGINGVLYVSNGN